MTPYPVIDVKATGKNILRHRIEKGATRFWMCSGT